MEEARAMKTTMWMVATAAWIATGCYTSSELEVDGGGVGARLPDGRVIPAPGTPDGRAPSPVDSGPPPPPPPPPTPDVDLLLVIDNSGSMSEEQFSLAVELPEIVRALGTGDLDGDGARDAPSVDSLHVGVITPDMGTGGFTVPTCARADFGDDGVFRTQGRIDIMGCMPNYPSFLHWTPTRRTTAEEFAEQVGCVAMVGTGGCGFEQPLEAALKALSPAEPTEWTSHRYAPPEFFRGTTGHGDGVNEGLVRPGSVLAIVMLTDEEDCSASDLNLFNPSDRTYGGTDLNLRCFAHASRALHPTSRYVEGLLQLRARAGRLAFIPIAGVPVDLLSGPGEPTDWASLVGPPGTRDPRLEERVDPSAPNRLVPSCDVPGRGVAFPPIRILQVAESLEARGARVQVGSVCQESHAGRILRGIMEAM
ncbi:MAG: hypothetical protein VYE22_36215 [Myxococcota bacterium]|nr:hypothetical protein [Myxococcota bacterium]